MLCSQNKDRNVGGSLLLVWQKIGMVQCIGKSTEDTQSYNFRRRQFPGLKTRRDFLRTCIDYIETSVARLHCAEMDISRLLSNKSPRDEHFDEDHDDFDVSERTTIYVMTPENLPVVGVFNWYMAFKTFFSFQKKPKKPVAKAPEKKKTALTTSTMVQHGKDHHGTTKLTKAIIKTSWERTEGNKDVQRRIREDFMGDIQKEVSQDNALKERKTKGYVKTVEAKGETEAGRNQRNALLLKQIHQHQDKVGKGHTAKAVPPKPEGAGKDPAKVQGQGQVQLERRASVIPEAGKDGRARELYRNGSLDEDIKLNLVLGNGNTTNGGPPPKMEKKGSKDKMDKPKTGEALVTPNAKKVSNPVAEKKTPPANEILKDPGAKSSMQGKPAEQVIKTNTPGKAGLQQGKPGAATLKSGVKDNKAAQTPAKPTVQVIPAKAIDNKKAPNEKAASKASGKA